MCVLCVPRCCCAFVLRWSDAAPPASASASVLSSAVGRVVSIVVPSVMSSGRSQLSAGRAPVNAAGFASQLPQHTNSTHTTPTTAPTAPQHTRPLSVAWPDAHPDALTPSHADRRADLLSEFHLPSSVSPSHPPSAGHSKHNSAHSDATAHTLQPLRSVMPAANGASTVMVPSPSAPISAHSSSGSPGLSAGHSAGLAALHSSTSHLLSTFGVQSATATGGELTPAKKKLNQFILDLVKNQIKITDDFSSMCRQKLREKDAQLHSLQMQLHDVTIEKDAMAAEFMQMRTQMSSLKANHEFTLKENQKLHMQVARADASSTAGPAVNAMANAGEMSSLKHSYETQLDHALLHQRSHYDSILAQMKTYLAEQEAQVASLKERIAVVQGERDDAKAALARAEESMRSRMAEAERRVEEAQRERSQARSEADHAIQARDEAKSEAQRALLQAEKRERAVDGVSEGGSCCRSFLCGSFWAVLLTILAVVTIASTLDATGVAPILCAKFVMGNSTSSTMQMHSQHAAVKCEACPAPLTCAVCPDPTVCPAQPECPSPVDCPAAVECPAVQECPSCPVPIECAACATPAPVEYPASSVRPSLDVHSALYRDLVARGLFRHVMDFDASDDEEMMLDSTGQPLSREGIQLALILRALNATDDELQASKLESTAIRANLTALRAQFDRSRMQSDGLTAQVLELKDQLTAAKAAAAELQSVDARNEEIAQADRERDELRAEVADLQAQLSLAREEAATNQAKIASMEQAHLEDKPEMHATAADADAGRANAGAMDSASGSSSDVSSAAPLDSAAQLSALNATLLSVQSELLALQSTHNSTLTELQLLNDIVAGQIELESDLDDAAASSSLATEVLKRLESMQSKLAGATADAGATTPTELRSSAAQLASTVSSLGADLDDVSRENESLRSINAEYEAVLELLQGNITALLNREHECITDLEALRADTEKAQARAEAASTRHADTTPAGPASDAEVAELATLRVEHASVLAELDRVQGQLEEQAAHIPTDEISAATQPAIDSEATSASLALCSTQLSACNASASALEGDMSSLEGALDKLQQQYAQAQEELHEAKRAAAAAAAKAKMDATLPQVACPVCPAPVPVAVPRCPLCPACDRAPVCVSGDSAVSVVSLPASFDSSGLIDLDVHDESNDGSSSLVAECTTDTDSYFYFEQFHERECSRFIHSTSDRLEHVKGLAELQGIGGHGWKDCPQADTQRGCDAPADVAPAPDAADTAELVRQLTSENSRLKLDLLEATAATALLSSDDASGTAAKLVELTSANAALQRDLDEAVVVVTAAANNTRSLTACQGSLREAQRVINETRKEMESLEAELQEAHSGAQPGSAASVGGQDGAAALEARLLAAEKDTRSLRADMLQAISEVEASIATGGSVPRRVTAADSIPRSVSEWLEFGSQVGVALRSFDLHELSYLSAAQRIVATFIYVIADVILFQLMLPRTRPWIALMVVVWAALSVLAAFQAMWIGLVLAAANTVLALLMCCKPSAALFAVGISMRRGGQKVKGDEADEPDAQPPRPNGVHPNGVHATAPAPPAMHASAAMLPLASLPPPMRPALNAAAVGAVPPPAHVSPQQVLTASRPMPAAGAPSATSPPAPRQLPLSEPPTELASPTRGPMPLPSQFPPPPPPSNMLPTLQPQHIPFLPPESPLESLQPHAQLPPPLPHRPAQAISQQQGGSRRGSSGLSDGASMLTPIPAFSPVGPADHFSSHVHSSGSSHPNSAGSQADASQVGSSVNFQLQPQEHTQASHHEYPADLTQEQQQPHAFDPQQQDAYTQQHFEYQQQQMMQQQQHGYNESQAWQQPQAGLPGVSDSSVVSSSGVHDFSVDPAGDSASAQHSPGLFGPDGGEFAAAMTRPIEYEQAQTQQGQQEQPQAGSTFSSQPPSQTVSPAHAHRPLPQHDEMAADFAQAPSMASQGGIAGTDGHAANQATAMQTQPHEQAHEQQPHASEYAAAAAPPSTVSPPAPAHASPAPVPTVSESVVSSAPMSALERKKAARKNFGGFAAAAAAAAAASSTMPTYSDIPASFPAAATPADVSAPLSPASMPPPRPSYAMPPPPPPPAQGGALSSRPPLPGVPATASSESAMDGTAMPPRRPGYAAAGGFGATNATMGGRFPMPPAFPQ